jgi:hypothetical protein
MFPAINVARVGLRATPRAARVQVSANQMVARRWLNDNAGNRTDDKAKLVRRTLLVLFNHRERANSHLSEMYGVVDCFGWYTQAFRFGMKGEPDAQLSCP